MMLPLRVWFAIAAVVLAVFLGAAVFSERFEVPGRLIESVPRPVFDHVPSADWRTALGKLGEHFHRPSGAEGLALFTGNHTLAIWLGLVIALLAGTEWRRGSHWRTAVLAVAQVPAWALTGSIFVLQYGAA